MKKRSESDSRATQKKLIENGSDDHIRHTDKARIIVFDSKNDDRLILVGGKLGRRWHTVQGPAAWSAFAAENTTARGEFNPLWATDPMGRIREIRGPDRSLNGFVIFKQRRSVSARLIDKNTMRMWSFGGAGAGLTQ